MRKRPRSGSRVGETHRLRLGRLGVGEWWVAPILRCIVDTPRVFDTPAPPRMRDAVRGLVEKVAVILYLGSHSLP